MTYVPGIGLLPWEQALLVASEEKPWPWENLARPASGAEAEAVYLEGSDLLFQYPGGVVKPAPGVHLFGKPVHHRDHGDGTGTLFTDGDVPQNGSVQVTFSPAVGPNAASDPSVSQIFGPYDDLHDQLGIIAFANFEIRFGVVIRNAVIVFESETARDEFNYGFDLTTWTLGGVSLKTAYDPGNTGWSHARFELNGVNEYSIQLVDPPADPTIVGLFAPEASHLLEWAPEGSWVEDELARVTELIRVTKEVGDWPAVGAGSWVPALSMALMHNPEWTQEELQEKAQLNVGAVGVASQPLLQDVLDSGMWEPPNLFYTIILTGTRDWEGAIGLLYKTDRFIKNQL